MQSNLVAQDIAQVI